MTEAWPLPLPEDAPFPEDLPIEALHRDGYYDGNIAAERANFWWMCAAAEALVEARGAEDVDEAAYWIDALTWWGSSSTRSLTFGDDGSRVVEYAESYLESSCDLPGRNGIPIETPATVEAAPAEVGPTRTPTPAPTAAQPPATGPNATECGFPGRFVTSEELDGTVLNVERLGEPKDFGPAEGANGTVELDADGIPVAYTIAPGDSALAIVDRLCMNGIFDLNGIISWVDGIPSGVRLSLLPEDHVRWG